MGRQRGVILRYHTHVLSPVENSTQPFKPCRAAMSRMDATPSRRSAPGQVVRALDKRENLGIGMIGEKPNWNFMPAQTAGYGNADMSSADNQRTGHPMPAENCCGLQSQPPLRLG